VRRKRAGGRYRGEKAALPHERFLRVCGKLCWAAFDNIGVAGKPLR
jgi:hypothetical protein